MSIAANQNTTLPALFEAHLIRRVFHNKEWHFSIVDVIAALTDSPNPSDYLSKRRRRNPEIRKGEGQFVHRLSVATAGGTQKVKCAPAEWIFRLIQNIPSPRAEPFKLWLG